LVRALRGAITVDNNDASDILSATAELLNEIIRRNDINRDDIISIIFTVTRDLDAAFPAVAARQMGLTDVALMCTNEMHVKGSLEKCIRILMHINTEKRNSDLKHVYLRGAKVLRPDIAD
jgi:chorismate mutase